MPRHGERAKNALLTAGAQLLVEAPIHKTLRSITAREVARRAGKTTGSFYNYWATQDDFCADLVDNVLLPDAVTVARLGEASGIAGLLEAVFDQQLAVDRFRLYLVMAGFANETHVAAALDRRAVQLERGVVLALESTLLAEGLAFREGRTPAELAVALTALADGFGIRCAGNLDGGRERERFVAAGVELIGAATLTGDDQRWSARQSVG